jgi:hypothetical protein
MGMGGTPGLDRLDAEKPEKGIKEENGKDHQRWRIPFFDEAGLFNLTAARQEGR